jgi:hypothetical protein
MHSESHDTHPHRNRHLAERFEGFLSKAMIGVVVLLAVGLVWMLMTTDSTPSWMR